MRRSLLAVVVAVAVQVGRSMPSDLSAPAEWAERDEPSVVVASSAGVLPVVTDERPENRWAALFLADVIEKTCGRRPKVVQVLKGQRCDLTAALFVMGEPSSDDSYRVEVGRGCVLFMGRADFAVFDWCERELGFRYYCEDGACAESRETIRARAVEYADRPVFTRRTISGGERWSRFARRGDTHCRGVQVHAPHGWYRDERLKATHPEIFETGRTPMLCYGNPETLAYYRERIDRHLSGLQDSGGIVDTRRKIVTVSPWDAPIRCECAWCRTCYAYRRSDAGFASPVIWGQFLSKLSLWLKAAHPDYTISFLPYMNACEVPKGCGFALADNCEAEVCVMPGLALLKDASVREREEQILRDWRAATGRKVSCWQYGCWPQERTSAPYVFGRTILRHYQAMRDVTCGTFVCGGDGDARLALSMYVWMKCLWNPDIDVEAVYDGFARRMFGPAERPMRALIALQEACWERPWDSTDCTYRNVFGTSYRPVDIRRMRELLQEAAGLAHDDESSARRVAWYASGFRRFFAEADALAARQAPVVRMGETNVLTRARAVFRPKPWVATSVVADQAGDALSLVVRCEDPAAATMDFSAIDDDFVWGDDCVTFVFELAGCVREAKVYKSGEIRGRRPPEGFSAQVAHDGAGWTVRARLRLPSAALDAGVVRGNVCRWRVGDRRRPKEERQPGSRYEHCRLGTCYTQPDADPAAFVEFRLRPRTGCTLDRKRLDDKANVRELSPVVPFVIPSGRPSAADVREIVDDLKAHGFDQFLVYPSTGLEYEYLGEEFFAMMGEFLASAKRNGMREWLYDEYNWPSGTAHGRVPAENEGVIYRELVAVTNAAGKVGWTNVVSRGINVDNYCLDTNNCEPAGVRRFMELTHRQYEQRFRPYLGTTVRGIFSDEPGHCSSAWRLEMPTGTALRVPSWSGMEDEYRAASGGREFRADCEAALRGDSTALTDVLSVWTEMRSHRYRRTYFDPIAAWCRSVGIESTGHLVGEDSPYGCSRVNGMMLHTEKGFTKPGIDLIKSDLGPDYEWLTLAFVQSASMANARPGMAELFGLGPCDLPFATMRKLYWICALHRVDTFLQGLYHRKAYRFQVKDSWAMFTSPTQPWYEEMPLLHETAKEAVRWAAKPFVCEIAVVYPQRRLGACGLAGLSTSPCLPELCRALTWNQFTYRLVEEDEKTDLPVVLDWQADRLFERSSGTRFADPAAAVRWLESRFPNRARVRDAAGRTRGGFVTRQYLDGSAVAVDIASGEVVIAPDGCLPNGTRQADEAESGRPLASGDWSLTLSGPTRRRMWFWAAKADEQRVTDGWLRRVDRVEAKPRYPRDNMTKVTLRSPLKGIRFALRHYPADRRFAVKMDGRPLDFSRPCKSVAYAFDDLYRETEPMELSAGEHVFELTGGKDGKMFLPVMWMVGDFAESEYGVLTPRRTGVPLGSLASVGLGSFAGTATYRREETFAAGERLRVDAGGAVVRVRLGGRDLGARGWAPFEWTVPAALADQRQSLEIDVITSVRPIFGDENAPDAKLDHALWVKPSADAPSRVGLLSVTRFGRAID